MLWTVENLVNTRTMLRTIILLANAKSALETDDECWASDSEVEDLDNDDFLDVKQGYGRSANTYPAGQGLASLRRQVRPPERSNKRLLNGCYVEWRCGAFVRARHRQPHSKLRCLVSLDDGISKGR
jgi:hypothetical protein